MVHAEEKQKNEEDGLSSAEARRRLLKYGKNILAKRKKHQPILVFVKKFKSPLLLILMSVSILSFFLGQRTNATIIFAMVTLSAIMDFLNTYRSERTIEKLLNSVQTIVTVKRDRKEQEVPMEVVVPGDLLLLSAGCIIPADGRVLQANDFYANESALTGESFPVEKHGGDQVFLGSGVVTGDATVVAEKTGSATSYGNIAASLSELAPETEFERGIKQFSYFTARVTSVLVVIVFLVNTLLGKGLMNSFLFAIAIAVGLTPELLPVIMSISLSRGSQRMAKKSVIVKNLSSIESIGGMEIFCTDKTGTLTRDHITLLRCIDAEGNDSETVARAAFLNTTFHTALKSPLDLAINEARAFDVSHFTKIAEFPFDYTRRRDSIALEQEGRIQLLTKGAPENILAISATYNHDDTSAALTPEKSRMLQQRFEQLSAEGFRVLAIAVKQFSGSAPVTIEGESNMHFLGFLAFLDPPKEGVRVAIDNLETLGVEMKILTGDSDLLTQKICRDIDIPVRGMLIGTEIAKMNNDDLQRRARTTTIFARLTPDQKERIILLLKKDGRTVGYLGDGVNDTPALRSADVGISVNNAVDVAKETADIILMEKSLDVLREGVVEGRKTFHNTMKYILMGLSSNFGNMVSMTAASAFLPFLPMLPAQILLNNFLYDASQLSLTTDAVDDDEIRRPPRWNMGFVKRYMLLFGPLSSVFDFLTFAFLFAILHLADAHFQSGWFIESLATQVFVIYIIRTKKVPFRQSWPSRLLLANTLLVVIAAWMLPQTPLGKIFSFGALSGTALLGIGMIVLVYLVAAEALKRFFYRHQERTPVATSSPESPAP
ncbi:MAG: magnesium-translocating P-type ATPase [bacterium]